MNSMFQLIDSWLDRITMYRLVLYYLILLVGIAVIYSTLGILNYSPVVLILSAAFITAVCWMSNQIFAHIFEVPANVESVYITALILVLIITPISDFHNMLFLAAAGGLAIASKFILVINKKHIFNPAAIAIVLTAFGPKQSATWWVGTTALLPYVIIGGLLIVRKIERGKMVGVFFAAAATSTYVGSLIANTNTISSLHKLVLHSSLFFLGFVMLTEPLTAPSNDSKRMIYGGIVGILFPPQVHIAKLFSTPELALVVGNLYSYMVSPKVKLAPKLIRKKYIGEDIIDFDFAVDKAFEFKPGQYMEFTLGHESPDSRGNRRYFTLASSPTEDIIKLGVKFYPEGSSYKEAMWEMQESTQFMAGQIGGDFTLPANPEKKLVFIAGGIGITPFRSMIKYLEDTGQRRDIVLIYSEKSESSLAYRDVFDVAERVGVATHYTLTDESTFNNNWQGLRGQISQNMIKSVVPNLSDRTFYISGSHGMVAGVKEQLQVLDIAQSHIKTDFFPGYA